MVLGADFEPAIMLCGRRVEFCDRDGYPGAIVDEGTDFFFPESLPGVADKVTCPGCRDRLLLCDPVPASKATA